MKDIYQSGNEMYHEQQTGSELLGTARNLARRPYEARNKPLRNFSVAAGYILQALIVVGCFSFFFDLVYSYLLSLPAALAISGVVSLAALVAAEWLVRMNQNGFFKDLFNPAVFDFEYAHQAGRIAFGIILIAGRGWMAFHGSVTAVNVLLSPPSRPEVAMQGTAPIEAHYQQLIADAGADADRFYKSRQWLNKLSDKDTREYNRLVQRKNGLQVELNAKLDSMATLNANAGERAEADHAAAMAAYRHDVATKGQNAGWFVLLCDFLLILALAYPHYYKFRSFRQYVLIKVDGSYELLPAFARLGQEVQASLIEELALLGLSHQANGRQKGKHNIPFSVDTNGQHNGAHNSTEVGFHAIRNRAGTVDTASTAENNAATLQIVKDAYLTWKKHLAGCQREIWNLEEGNGVAETIKGRLREKYRLMVEAVPLVQGRLEKKEIEAMNKVVAYVVASLLHQ